MNKLFLLILIVFSLNSIAQKSHFGLSMGTAVPLGDFAATGDYLKNGYAKQGFNLSFDGNYIPSWYFGVGGSLSFANNGSDETALLTAYLKYLDGIIDPTIEIPDDAEINITVGNWTYVNIMVGPTVAIPGDYLQLNLKALFGINIAMPPGGSIEIITDNQRYMTYNNDQTVGFGYTLGTDLIYKLSGGYSVKFGAEYFGSKAKYSISNELSAGADPSTTEKIVKLQALHATIGLAFLF